MSFLQRFLFQSSSFRQLSFIFNVFVSKYTDSMLCFSLYFLIETTETLVMILCDEQPALFCAAAREPQVGGGAAGGFTW